MLYYYYGKISKISRWEHGKEIEILKKFDGLTMQVFKKGKEVFSGRYKKQSDFEYVPIYPTEIETKSDSIKSKKEKKRDDKCTYDRTCFSELILKIMLCLVFAIVFEVILLVIILIINFDWAWVMIYCLALMPCLYVVVCIVGACVMLIDDCYHKCNCF